MSTNHDDVYILHQESSVGCYESDRFVVMASRVCNMYPVLAVCLLLTFVDESKGTESCPQRQAEPKGRLHCTKACHPQTNRCKSSKKTCLCDGVCGFSCISKNHKCVKLEPKIPNGEVKIKPFNEFGSIAYYECDDGFVVKGDGQRVCQGDKSWSGEEPSCIVSQLQTEKWCGRPPNISNAVHDGQLERYPTGTMLLYACKPDYKKDPDSVERAWCVGGGTWVGPRLSCRAAGCPTPPSIASGGIRQPVQTTIGSTVSYYCHSGFHLAGRTSRTCLADSTWDGREPTCEKVTCSDPPTIKMATSNADNVNTFPAGTTITYQCNTGYRGEGHEYTRCDSNGRWSSIDLNCKPVDCGFPGTVENGLVDGYIFHYPYSIEFRCQEGYRLEGNARRTCQANGEWSNDIPKCIAVDCPFLSPPINGRLFGAGNAHGTVITFECNDEYQLEGSVERRCLENGEWSGSEAKCKAEVDCGWPQNFWNGYVLGDKTTLGSTMFFSCLVRTTYDGQYFDTQCLKNGSWSNPPPKCWGQCPIPSVKEAEMLDSPVGTWIDHGHTFKYRCKNGLVPVKSSVVKCYNGTFDSKPKCVPAPCPGPPPHVEGGMRLFIGREDGRRAKYICRNGYRLTGIGKTSPYLECDRGRWVGGNPKCEEIFCPNPGSITNGRIYKKEANNQKFIFGEYITTIKHGQRLEYKCNSGFRLSGPSGATCINGKWYPPLGDRNSHCQKQMHLPFPILWTPITNSNFYEER